METLKTITSLRKDNRSGSDSVQKYDLPALIVKMKNSYTWAHGELKAMILMKNPINIVMKQAPVCKNHNPSQKWLPGRNKMLEALMPT